jgi:hypothetical protein
VQFFSAWWIVVFTGVFEKNRVQDVVFCVVKVTCLWWKRGGGMTLFRGGFFMQIFGIYFGGERFALSANTHSCDEAA